MNRHRFLATHWVLLLVALVWLACAIVAITARDRLHASVAVAAMISASALAWHAWHQQMPSPDDREVIPPVVAIQAAPVQRNEEGYWTHPSMPEFEESEEEKGSAWLEATGLETHIAYLEDEAMDHPACAQYFGDEGSSDISAWEPPRPEGRGWFVLSIHDTEDWGPICAWARNKETSNA